MRRRTLRGGGGFVCGSMLAAVMLAAPGCKRAAPPTAPARDGGAAPAATVQTVPAAVGVRHPETLLRPVEPRTLSRLPERFDPSGRLMAVIETRALAGPATGAAAKPAETKGAEARDAGASDGGSRAAGVGDAAGKTERESLCALWEVKGGSFLGEVPEARCAAWQSASVLRLPDDAPDVGDKTYGNSEGQSSSREGRRSARWKDDSLTLVPAPGAAPIPITAGCTEGPCLGVIAASFSPDGKRLAFARLWSESIQVVDATSGKPLHSLALDGKAVLPEQLAWGAHGLVAVLMQVPAAVAKDKPGDAAVSAGAAGADAKKEAPAGEQRSPDTDTGDKDKAGKDGDDDEDPERTVRVSVLLWTDGQGKAQERGIDRRYSSVDDGGQLTLDPFGRFLYELRSQHREPDTLTTFDLSRNDPLGGVNWDSKDDDCEEKTTLLDGHWIPGKWPIWESVEETTSECSDKTYRAWRLLTAPGQRRLRVVEAGKRDPSEGPARTVKDDGRTIVKARGKAAAETGAIDAERRWKGKGKGVLKRLADGQELTFEKDGCVRVPGGVFDCALYLFEEQVFLLGSDPLSAPVVYGDQVAHLFYRPGLVDDFFAGKPLAPLPAAAAAVGLPPKLEVVSAQPRADGGPLRVTLLATDGGDGVSVARAWLGGLPLGERQPITAGQPSTIQLDVPEKRCREPLLIYACNALGAVCSVGQKVAACGDKK